LRLASDLGHGRPPLGRDAERVGGEPAPERVEKVELCRLDHVDRDLFEGERRGELCESLRRGLHGHTVQSASVPGKVGAASSASRLKTMNVRLNSITTSRRWLTPRQRIETMPMFGRDPDSRSSRISLSAQSVSPSNTGCGRVMSVQARFAAAFSLVAGTGMPVTGDSVNAELTSGRP